MRADGVHNQPEAHKHIGQVAKAEQAVSGNERDKYGGYGDDFGIPNGAVGRVDARSDDECGDENGEEERDDWEGFLHRVDVWG